MTHFNLKHKVSPNKLLGQNFLMDKKVLKIILGAAEIKPDDVVLEVGPGTGFLTKELAKQAKKVIAVEKDSRLVKLLQQEFKDFDNVKIIEGDIRNLKLTNLQITKKYKIVANIPYYLTSYLIRQFLENKNQPELMALMLQKEVAKRIVAKPPDMNLLAVSVQFYAVPKIINYVSKKSFWPVPKVDSAIIKIAPQKLASKKQISTDKFFKIVKAGFSQPRKQLLNNLSKGLKIDKQKITAWLSKNKINPTQRAETLNIANWVNLYNTFKLL